MAVGCCLLALVVLLAPRIVLTGLFFFTNALSVTFDNWIIPLLGFIFVPFTTLAWTYIIAYDGGWQEKVGQIVLLVVALALDISNMFSSKASVKTTA